MDSQVNAESCEGCNDISAEVEDGGIGIVVELKYAENILFENGCKEEFKQIRDRYYEEALGCSIFYT